MCATESNQQLMRVIRVIALAVFYLLLGLQCYYALG